jgi:hypothetical protein
VYKIYQVAFLLEPNLKYLFGFPPRVEVLYGYIGIFMLATAVYYNEIPLSVFLQAIGYSNKNT